MNTASSDSSNNGVAVVVAASDAGVAVGLGSKPAPEQAQVRYSVVASLERNNVIIIIIIKAL